MSQPLEAGLQERIDIIEQTYEFMLAYAAQGLSGNEAGGPGSQIRDFLQRCNSALEGLPEVLKRLVKAKQLEPTEPYGSFINIVEQDTDKTQTAIRLMLAQHSISSQLIDNLNAWIHLRALLTDLFVMDESLKNA